MKKTFTITQNNSLTITRKKSLTITMKKTLTIALTLLLAIAVFAQTGTEAFASNSPGANKSGAGKPAKVTGVSAKAASSTSITLKWKKTKGAKGYQIYRVTKNSSKKIAAVNGASKTTYTVKKLKSNTKYSFKIRAFNKVNNKKKYGAFSKTISAVTKSSAPVKPAKVTGVSAEEASSTSVTLKWNKANRAKGYQICKVTKDGSKIIATVSGAAKTTYTVKNLKSNTKYTFKIRAFNKVNKKKKYGAFSKTVSITLHKKPTVLLILDGFGIREESEHNAIAQADTPVLDRLMKECPYVTGAASGLAVGLPEGQMGSSEVGHLNIGAGRIVDQDLVRISKTIESGEFFENEAFLKAINNAKENDSSLHLVGLASDGGVHAHNSHLFALLELAKSHGLEKVYVHFFTDGRDTAPEVAKDYIQELQAKMDSIGCGKIATVGGRYYGMDRDNNWDRIEKAYLAMTLGEGVTADSAIDAVTLSYQKGETDEFIQPTVIMENDAPVATVNDKDSIIYFNYRSDRAKELTRAFCADEFDESKYFDRGPRKQVTFVCFTDYDSTVPNKEVAFGPMDITNNFGEWISANGLKQVRIAETEKYAHVTSFFNGGVQEPYEGEDRILIPSSKEVATYDLKPEMSINGICDAMIDKIHSGEYDVIITNFANSDMVGHTGVEAATIEAVKYVDESIGRVVEAVEEVDGQLFICADHGNAEVMVDSETGSPWTAHTTNPVPFILVNYDPAYTLREGGCLADVAPTLLEMMGLEQPAEMTGHSLLIKK